MVTAMILKLRTGKRLKGGGRKKRNCVKRRSAGGVRSDVAEEKNGVQRS